MVDIVDIATRSSMMSKIRSKNTKPEVIIRKGLFRKGFRFRIHSAVLPGKPDLVLPKYKAVIFINGCFWHAHDCFLFKRPSTRPEFWNRKLNSNRKRDKMNEKKLISEGWRVLKIWECSFRRNKKFEFIDEVIDSASKWLTTNKQVGEIRL